MITTICKISYGSQTVPPIVTAVQGDTGRAINFEVSDFTPPAGATATYFILKPSGEAIYNSATIADNNILCELTAQSLAETGENRMQVRVLLGEDIVTSFEVILMVRKFLGDDAIESGTEMNIFDQAVEQAAEDFQSQAEQIVEGVIESIPADYTELTEEVDELNERFSQLYDNALLLKNAKPYGFGTSDGYDIPNQTSYWNTGIIEIPDGTTLKSNVQIYKTAFFDEDKVFISCNTSSSANVAVPSGSKYIKVQFANSVIAYTDRANVTLSIDDITLTKISNLLLELSDYDNAVEAIDGMTAGSSNKPLYAFSNPYGFNSTNGEDNESATGYWNTGLLDIPSGGTTLTSDHSVYKTAFFNENRVFISTNTTTHSNVTIPTGTRYIKCQFENTNVAYTSRYNVNLFVDGTKLIKVSNLALPFKGVGKDNLTEDIQTALSSIQQKQNAPAVIGTKGQVLGLDSNLNPIWTDQQGGGDVTEEELLALVDSAYSETTSGGSEVHITNGSVLPFQSLIADIDLVQSGSGDASLNNIRPISPVTGVTVCVSETQGDENAEEYGKIWGSIAGSLAAGKVDLAKGTLIETWEFISVLWKDIKTGNPDQTTGLQQGSYVLPHAVEKATASSAYGTSVICNVCSTIMWQAADRTPEHFYISQSGAFNIFLPSTTDGDLEIQLAVKLTTPIEYSIGKTAVYGLEDCYVWANTGDIESVSCVTEINTFVEDTRRANAFIANINDEPLLMENAVPFGFATASGEDSLAATTYWNTGLIQIPDGSSILSVNVPIYKTAFYGSNYAFISCNNTVSENVPIPFGSKYVKIQIENSNMTFANRGNLRVSCDGIELTKISNSVIPGVFMGIYEYEGERITPRPTYNTFALIASDSCQAGCVYGSELFRFKTNGTFVVYDLTTRTKVADGSGIVVNTLYPHCNTACFGKKYTSSDPYPLLYVNAYNTEGMPKGTCYVFRISVNGSTMTASLIQTITIGFVEDTIWESGSDIRPYGNFCVDVTNNALFVYTLRDTDMVTRFFKFALPDVSTANITLSQSDIVEYWDVDYYPYIQDNAYAYGKIYLCSGYGGSNANPGMIHVVDTIQRKETSRINLYKNGMQTEPEVLDFYNGDLICGDANIYRFVF